MLYNYRKAFFHLQKILLGNFLPNVLNYLKWLPECFMDAKKVKTCYRAKFGEKKMFAAGFVSVSCGYRLTSLITLT